MINNKLIINPMDNVAICLERNSDVPYGHKVALVDIHKGKEIVKYGYPIGIAKEDIKAGSWVHSHNLSSGLNESKEYEYKPALKTFSSREGTFLGYKRKHGRAGIRNDIYIIPTVGCVNSVVKEIEKRTNQLELGSIDSIISLTHQFGCSQLGEDNENIKNLLCSLALNPNASFVLFVGLGCENNQLSKVKEQLDKYNRDNIFYYNCQEVSDDVEYGFSIIKHCVEIARNYKREDVSLSELCLGLKCGGSDAFSGITANPTVGRVSDEIITYGGSAIFTEVPEMFGAEQILMNKCESKEVFDEYKNLIINFKKYYSDLGFPVYENPSPGNKEGGITTLEEKSLGCVTKAGSFPIQKVLNYAEIDAKPGLNVLNAPGNDLVASTALAASGCQLILFTTGRGTPFSTLVPTLKIATNNELAIKKKNWIDFDASDMDGNSLFNLVIDCASGKYKAKQEDSHEFAFFKKGVIL